MDIHQPNNFLFSSKYRVWRHIAFWVLQILLLTFAWVLPRLLLKGRYVQFGVVVLLWVLAAWFVNYYFRLYIMFRIRDTMGIPGIGRNPWQQGNLFSLIAVWGFACTTALFKHWLKKQQEWLQAEKEIVTAELQLLKAQVHPHFLFNTLNNIYSFSLTNSTKTPELILKLSSLLSYMLYDCKAEQVLLEKEIEVMKDYVDLERERYGNTIEISWNIDGDIEDKYIAPLLLLPFLEGCI